MRPSESLNDDIRLLGHTLGDVIADQAARRPSTRRVDSPQRRSATPTRRTHRAARSAAHRRRAARHPGLQLLRNAGQHRRGHGPCASPRARPCERRAAAAGHAAHARSNSSPTPGSTAPTCIDAVGASEVVPVLTAHPTEIRRKTIQSIQTAVAALMAQRDRLEMNHVEEAGVAATSCGARSSRCGRPRCCGLPSCDCATRSTTRCDTSSSRCCRRARC